MSSSVTPLRLEPSRDGQPAPIEILARMSGRSSFRTPKSIGNATNVVPVTPLDIAHAIATTADKMGAAMAMAMACQRPFEWPKVERLGHTRVLTHLRAQRRHPGLVDAPYTFRARVALYDAFHDLIAPTRFRNFKESASDLRMGTRAYRYLLHETCAYLEAAANTAAADAVRFLFASIIEEAHARGEDVRIVITPEGDVAIETVPVDRLNIDVLCDEVLRRPRRDGVLVLRTPSGNAR